jgi:competence protein CoiA
MRYALDEDSKKIETEYSGQRTRCSGCEKEVTGKIYRKKKNHWAHLIRDCDKWYEPISDWHIKWQDYFPKENQEVTLYDENNEEFHRADILLNNGSVIEIQNSPIAINEVSQREKFYNRNGLIWILNADNLIPKSKFMHFILPESCEIIITFFKPDYWEFTTDDIIKDLRNKNYHPLDFYRGRNTSNEIIEYIFHSTSVINPTSQEDDIASSINSLNWKYSRENYDKKKPSFNVKIRITSNKYRISKFLDKKQWKSFIDEMKAPVFLDNVKDLAPDYLYWVQKSKIIEKKIILEKSLKHI